MDMEWESAEPRLEQGGAWVTGLALPAEPWGVLVERRFLAPLLQLVGDCWDGQPLLGDAPATLTGHEAGSNPLSVAGAPPLWTSADRSLLAAPRMRLSTTSSLSSTGEAEPDEGTSTQGYIGSVDDDVEETRAAVPSPPVEVSAPISPVVEDVVGARATPQWVGDQLQLPTPAVHLGAGDLDQDGYADLAVARAEGGSLAMFRGCGDGTFALVREVALGFNPERVFVADFTGDSKLDVIAANWALHKASLLVSDGAFSFRTPKPIGCPGTAEAAWFCQLNEHPASEFVWLTADGPVVWSFLANGQVVEWKTAPQLAVDATPLATPYVRADFTGDSSLELVYYSDNPGELLLAAGSTVTDLGTTPGRTVILELAAADVDNDGQLELLVLDVLGLVYTVTVNVDKG